KLQPNYFSQRLGQILLCENFQESKNKTYTCYDINDLRFYNQIYIYSDTVYIIDYFEGDNSLELEMNGHKYYYNRKVPYTYFLDSTGFSTENISETVLDLDVKIDQVDTLFKESPCGKEKIIETKYCLIGICGSESMAFDTITYTAYPDDLSYLSGAKSNDILEEINTSMHDNHSLTLINCNGVFLIRRNLMVPLGYEKNCLKGPGGIIDSFMTHNSSSLEGLVRAPMALCTGNQPSKK
ncbi:MAG: hypothetical protein RLZ10_2464, partial [Bacteroidota bacterium]